MDIIELIKEYPYVFGFIGIVIVYKFAVHPDVSEKGEEVLTAKTYNEAKVKSVDYAKRNSRDKDYEYSEAEDKVGVFFIVSYIGKGLLAGIKYILVPVEKPEK